MALINPVNTAQIQNRMDEFCDKFLDLSELSQDLGIFNSDHLVEAMVSAGKITNVDGSALDAATLAELKARLAVIAGFNGWATTNQAGLGNKSPERYLRGIKKTV